MILLTGVMGVAAAVQCRDAPTTQVCIDYTARMTASEPYLLGFLAVEIAVLIVALIYRRIRSSKSK